MPAAGLFGTQNSQGMSGDNFDAMHGTDGDTRRIVQNSTGGGEYAESWDSREEAARRLSAGFNGQNKGRYF